MVRNRRLRNICIVFLFIVLFVYLSIGINSIMNKNKIGFFSWHFYIMSSDSPEAGVNTGDLVIAKGIKTQDIKENDNIIYKRKDEMIVKKIINKDKGNDNLYIQDSQMFTDENVQIIGKVLFKIKGLGNVALFIQSPLGTLNVLIIAICLLIVIKKISKSIQGEKNDEKC